MSTDPLNPPDATSSGQNPVSEFPKPASQSQDDVATRSRTAICAREGCDQEFTRKRGRMPQRYCSTRCRWKAWEKDHPRVSKEEMLQLAANLRARAAASTGLGIQ